MAPDVTMPSKGELELLFELSTDLLATADGAGYFIRLNPAWERTLGWSREELLTTPLMEFVHPDDRARTSALNRTTATTGEIVGFENRYRHKNGEWRWLLWSAHSEGGVWYAVAKDVTERKLLEAGAVEDPLTGLPNRAVLLDRLRHARARQTRSGSLLAILFLDLDRFKAVNDLFGHDVGDRLLTGAAARLRLLTRASDTLARLGGDEFVIVAEDVGDPAAAIAFAERIVEAFAAPQEFESELIQLGATVGLALAEPGRGGTPEELLREADMAMYRAKANGRSRYAVFDEAMRAEVGERRQVSQDLLHALDRGEFRIVYQPFVRVADGSVEACEALLRWDHPTRGEIPPTDFVPLAEENGLVVPIGDWVLRTACRQAAKWRRAGKQITVSVNVSPVQLGRPGFAARVAEVIGEAGVPPGCITLEVVEASLVREGEGIARTLRELRGLGVRLALDDFGKGATSLSYFRDIPVDVVKLDRAFAPGLREGVEDRAIVAGILSLAAGMSIDVVAEGIETEDQLAALRELGCPYAQGYLFAPAEHPDNLHLDGFQAEVRPGLGDPSVIREFMRQIGIPARIR